MTRARPPPGYHFPQPVCRQHGPDPKWGGRSRRARFGDDAMEVVTAEQTNQFASAILMAGTLGQSGREGLFTNFARKIISKTTRTPPNTPASRPRTPPPPRAAVTG